MLGKRAKGNARARNPYPAATAHAMRWDLGAGRLQSHERDPAPAAPAPTLQAPQVAREPEPEDIEPYAVTGRKWAWSDAELTILRDNYGKMPTKDLTALLPGRTSQAIDNRISLMGLAAERRGRPVPIRAEAAEVTRRERKAWTDTEDAALRALAGLDKTTIEIAAVLDRPVTSVASRAKVIGIVIKTARAPYQLARRATHHQPRGA